MPLVSTDSFNVMASIPRVIRATDSIRDDHRLRRCASRGRSHQLGHRFRPVALSHYLNDVKAARFKFLKQSRQRRGSSWVDVVQQQDTTAVGL